MEQIQHFLAILRDLIGIYSPTGGEQQISEHIISSYFDQEHWDVKSDEMFNIMATPKGSAGRKLPLLNAHLDVYPLHTGQGDILLLEQAAKSLAITEGNDWLVRPDFPLQLGFDDAAGVALILLLASHRITTFPPFKVLLSSREERGRKGVQYCLEQSPHFFEKIPWAITLDRHGGADIISVYHGLVMAPDSMIDAIEKISADVGYPMKRAISERNADPFNIARETGIPIVNLSCGIHDEHSRHDRLNIREAIGVYHVVSRCLEVEDLVNGACSV